MYISFDRSGKITRIEKSSWIDIEWIDDTEGSGIAHNACEAEVDRISAGDHTLDRIQICITDNKLRYIALPAYYRGELLYAFADDDLCIADDLYEIAKTVPRLNVIQEMKSYFLKKGYLPIGHTLFEEIGRLQSNSIYTFKEVDQPNEYFLKKKDIQLKTISFRDDEEAYHTFKQKLNRIVKDHVASNNAILLSGGVDSRLLLVLLKEYSDTIRVVTSSSIPHFAGNCSDVLIAEKVAKLLGLDIEISEISYADLDISELNSIIHRMPFCVHTGINFSRMCSSLSDLHNITVFCGQNMDTLYNLGPTERMRLDFHGIAQWFKRFYLSEEYIRLMPDVEGKGNIWSDLLGKIGLQLFRRTTHQADLQLPANADELIAYFAHSNDYTVFGKGTGNDGIIRVGSCGKELRSAFDVKTELYKIKLSYLKGGDSQAVETGGYLNGVKIVLPYSEQEMVEYLSNLHLTKKDVWKPKRYSYQYLNEFIPKYGNEIASFVQPSAAQLKERFGDVQDLYVAFEGVLNNTSFGQSLSKGAGIEASGYTGLQRFDSLLRAYWFNKVINMLQEECGVEIS